MAQQSSAAQFLVCEHVHCTNCCPIFVKFFEIFSYELICGDGIVGDSVRIENERASLTLCEVKVYGEDKPVRGWSKD